VDGDQIFSPFSWKGSLIGDSTGYKGIKKNHWLWRKSISLNRDHVGEHGGGLFARMFERKGEYFWVPFLEPEDIQILSLGVILNFVKE
jgi:hypothetical protein